MLATFQRSENLNGAVSVPGDKSISHRAAILASLANGDSSIAGYSPAGDCRTTLECLRGLGVEVELDGDTVRVAGCAEEGFTQPAAPLNAGNSATTMRLLAGALSGQHLTVTITGDESLVRRPMGRIVEPLTLMGAGIAATSDVLPPITIRGGDLRGIDYSPAVASAQVKSAILIAGLAADGTTIVREKVRTRDHTERMLASMGIKVTSEGTSVTLSPGTPRPRDFEIPGDISSAAFIIAAALLCPGSMVTLESVGLNPTRTGFLELLRRMGASMDVRKSDADAWEPRGDIVVKHSSLSGIDISEDDAAGAIDELPLIALLASQARGTTEIFGAGELRAKESDRIAGTVESLANLGARVREKPDGISVSGPTPLVGSRVSSQGDHRIAMMLAVAGLAARSSTIVDGWEWTRISYPGFVEVITGLGGRAHAVDRN